MKQTAWKVTPVASSCIASDSSMAACFSASADAVGKDWRSDRIECQCHVMDSQTTVPDRDTLQVNTPQPWEAQRDRCKIRMQIQGCAVITTSEKLSPAP